MKKTLLAAALIAASLSAHAEIKIVVFNINADKTTIGPPGGCTPNLIMNFSRAGNEPNAEINAIVVVSGHPEPFINGPYRINQVARFTNPPGQLPAGVVRTEFRASCVSAQ